MTKDSRIDTRLQRAADSLRLVRVCREDGWEGRKGYVASVGAKWVLMSMVDDRSRPDGFSAVRRRDISSVTRARQCERFVRRALEMNDNWPPAAMPDGVDLDRTRGVVAGLAASFPLVTVMIEREDPDVAFIGRPQRCIRKTFLMREITPNAEWRGPRKRDWSQWAFGELTRVDAGGGYESALAMVGGDPPASR